MNKKFTYKGSGVDIQKASKLVDDISLLRKKTEVNKSLMQSFGLFAASYDLSDYKNPVIVTGCDGVGTKLELLIKYDQLEIAGKDLVAMSVNDILTTGADPLMFLDYIGISKINDKKINRLISGMSEYLSDCDCILAGGETAEMPGLVPEDLFEISGFCVGASEKSNIIDPSRVEVGDKLVGYPSNGFHANGWSLVRKVIKENPKLINSNQWEDILAPTALYHNEIKEIRSKQLDIKAMCHITGGGLPENLTRVLGGKGALVSIPKWEDEIINKILYFIDAQESINTFNMGWGWVVILPSSDADELSSSSNNATILGEVNSSRKVEVTLK